jgi:hypothetical protein
MFLAWSGIKLHSGPLGVRKCILAASLASTDNVDPAAVKRRKLEEDAAALRRQQQPSVELVVDDDDLPSNFLPRNASRVMEAADGSDDDDVDMVDDDFDKLPGLEPVDSSECDESHDGGDNDEEGEEEEEESAEAELSKFTIDLACPRQKLTKFLPARLIEDWTSPIYAFFGPIPDITYNTEGRRAHEFRCSAGVCKGKGTNKRIVRRYLDTLDRTSSSNLKRHAILCWGGDMVSKALDAKVDIESARKTLGALQDGSITAAFERKGKGKVSYSHRQHTKAETR